MKLPSRRWKLPAARCADLLDELPFADQLSVIAHLSCAEVVLQARLSDRPVLYAAAQKCLAHLAPLDTSDQRRVIEHLAAGQASLPDSCWSCGYTFKMVDDRSTGKCPECFTDWLPFEL